MLLRRVGADAPLSQINKPRNYEMTESSTKSHDPPDEKGYVAGINLKSLITDDIKAGLPVIIYARWVLVVAGLALTLWNSNNLAEAQVSVLIIMGLAIGNFFLQVEVGRKGTIPKYIVYGASIVDIAAISGVLAMSNVFPASTYVFYMPALLALSVTFSTANTAKFTVAALLAYALLVIAPINDAGGGKELTTGLLIHLIILVAVPFCGNVYWRLERSRRVSEIETDLIEQQLTDNFETTPSGGDA
jgi:hypothetical protein